jgi:hypothetical protein
MRNSSLTVIIVGIAGMPAVAMAAPVFAHSHKRARHAAIAARGAAQGEGVRATRKARTRARSLMILRPALGR